MNRIYPGTLSFYRRLLKTMMKTFKGDHEMFHQFRLEASTLYKETRFWKIRTKQTK